MDTSLLLFPRIVKIYRKRTCVPLQGSSITVQDINMFFDQCMRQNNDSANKRREQVLVMLYDPPYAFINNSDYGKRWKLLSDAWKESITFLSKAGDFKPYTSVKMTLKAGRKFHYDADMAFMDGKTIVASKKIEFKHNCSSIAKLPQFLSLSTKTPLFPVSYERFYYENYIDQYIVQDPSITVQKPDIEPYLTLVTGINYDSHPFFSQLKCRDSFFKEAKNRVVNASISDYLQRYGSSISKEAICERIRSTQKDKIYLLWSTKDCRFNIDEIQSSEMDRLGYHGIKNNNTLVLFSGTTYYSLLLRWRNHKGILNPAWQISMKRNETNHEI